MTCKLCGKNLFEMPDDPETRQWLAEIRKEFEPMSCEELAQRVQTETYYHRHYIAKQILIERGHDEYHSSAEVLE